MKDTYMRNQTLKEYKSDPQWTQPCGSTSLHKKEEISEILDCGRIIVLIWKKEKENNNLGGTVQLIRVLGQPATMIPWQRGFGPTCPTKISIILDGGISTNCLHPMPKKEMNQLATYFEYTRAILL